MNWRTAHRHARKRVTREMRESSARTRQDRRTLELVARAMEDGSLDRFLEHYCADLPRVLGESARILSATFYTAAMRAQKVLAHVRVEVPVPFEGMNPEALAHLMATAWGRSHEMVSERGRDGVYTHTMKRKPAEEGDEND